MILEPFTLSGSDEVVGYTLMCPGCNFLHSINIKRYETGGNPVWTFNGDMEKPTFAPSLRVRMKYGDEEHERVCHSFIRDGVWQFLNDCTHDLKGQHVPIPEHP